MKKKLDFWSFVKFFIFILLFGFMVLPLVLLFYKSFLSKTGTVSLENFRTIFSYKYYYQALLNSLTISSITTGITILLGVPMAYLISRFNILGKRIIKVMIILSLMSPPFIGAYSWIILLGQSGSITTFFKSIGIHTPPIYGMFGIILVFTFKLFPYIFLYVSGALSSVDSSLEEAAENLGASKLKRLLTITFPVILPTIAAGAIMVFMSSLADFGTPMLIGTGYKVLPALIYEEFLSEIGGNSNMASALSVVIVLCSTLILVIQKKIVAKKNYSMSALRPAPVQKLRVVSRLLLSALCFLVAFIAFLPQIVVIYTSFLKTNGPIFAKGFSLESYHKIMRMLSSSIKNTFVFSAVAIFIIIIVGMFVSYLSVRRKSFSSNMLDVFVMFPYVIPGTVLGISLLLTFNSPPVVLAGTPFILILAYVIRKMPFTVRSASGILYQIDSNIEEASVNLGVPPMMTFFKITARLMLPGVLSGAILSWIGTINELSSSIMLYSGQTKTIAVEIFTNVSSSSYGTAAALATILTITTILSLIIFSVITKGKASVV